MAGLIEKAMFASGLDKLLGLEGGLAALRDTINSREDQVLILDMGQIDLSIEKALETLGRTYEPPGRVLVV